MPETFLYTGTDHWTLTLPQRCWNRGEVFRWIFEGTTPVSLETGPAGRVFLDAMIVAVDALVQSGHSVVVETGFWGEELERCRDRWVHLAPLFVSVRCPLEVLEAREVARGDRMPGLARLQFSLIPAEGSYDVELDTSLVSPADAAESIKQRLHP